jgi:uncharacterized membrane protein
VSYQAKLARDDEGSILPLAIFFGFLALALVLLVVAASSLYLERKRLFSLADGAALVGAESFDLDQVSPEASGTLRVTLHSSDVAAAVSDYVANEPRDSFTGLAIDRAGTTDGRSATVELSAYWRPPVVSVLVPKGIRIDVTSVARSVFR